MIGLLDIVQKRALDQHDTFRGPFNFVVVVTDGNDHWVDEAFRDGLDAANAAERITTETGCRAFVARCDRPVYTRGQD